jgi:hypothetical protein
MDLSQSRPPHCLTVHFHLTHCTSLCYCESGTAVLGFHLAEKTCQGRRRFHCHRYIAQHAGRRRQAQPFGTGEAGRAGSREPTGRSSRWTDRLRRHRIPASAVHARSCRGDRLHSRVGHSYHPTRRHQHRRSDPIYRAAILFTDGEELEGDTLQAAREQSIKMRIFTVGVGSKEGSLIPIRDPDGNTTFVKDMDGRIVKSRLDEERLRQIAEVTGGFYLHLETGMAEMDELVRRGITQLKEKEGAERISREPIERYEWPLTAGIVLIAATMCINERRGRRESGRSFVPKSTAS